MKIILIHLFIIVSSFSFAGKVQVHIIPLAKTYISGTLVEAEVILTGSVKPNSTQVVFHDSTFSLSDNRVNISAIAVIPSDATLDSAGRYVCYDTVSVILNAGKKKSKIIKTPFFYYVVKPFIQVQQGAAINLYANCVNELQINLCGSTGAISRFTYQIDSSEGKVVSRGNGKIYLIPNRVPKVTLTVFGNGVEIWKEKFKVELVPRPEIMVKYNGKEVNQKTGMKAPGPRSLNIAAIADDGFKTKNPREAQYSVTKWEAYLVRKKRPVVKQQFHSSKGSLASFTKHAQPGDRILIEVLEVRRKKASGGNEIVHIGTTLISIPIIE